MPPPRSAMTLTRGTQADPPRSTESRASSSTGVDNWRSTTWKPISSSAHRNEGPLCPFTLPAAKLNAFSAEMRVCAIRKNQPRGERSRALARRRALVRRLRAGGDIDARDQRGDRPRTDGRGVEGLTRRRRICMAEATVAAVTARWRARGRVADGVRFADRIGGGAPHDRIRQGRFRWRFLAAPGR